MSSTMRGIDYENQVLNHMDNMRRRSIRHAVANDIKQIYASDVPSLKKLNISELNKHKLQNLASTKDLLYQKKYFSPKPTQSENRIM